ncbi:MAG: hypothetical protein LBR62_01095 [Puniceicoccales bacterium]|jgi:hypothetical protein|nr:hypothetical protein [Puniceicoccales bacterium]
MSSTVPLPHHSNSTSNDGAFRRENRELQQKTAKDRRETIRDQLIQMDERLQQLEKFFADSKLGGERNSLFTPDNVQKMSDWVRQTDPHDWALIKALGQLKSLARLPFKTLKSESLSTSTLERPGGISRTPSADDRCRLHQLANRIPLQRTI